MLPKKTAGFAYRLWCNAVRHRAKPTRSDPPQANPGVALAEFAQSHLPPLGRGQMAATNTARAFPGVGLRLRRVRCRRPVLGPARPTSLCR